MCERNCDTCEKQVNEGFVILDGEEYFHEGCMSKKYSEAEYNRMYRDGVAYYTEWGEGE